MPRIRAAAANNFPGPRLGYDDDGYAIYDATRRACSPPLTPPQFASFAVMSSWHPVAKERQPQLHLRHHRPVHLPAGDARFRRRDRIRPPEHRINPDPLALTEDRTTARATATAGAIADHWSAAGELRLPLLSNLQASLAGRYDRYSYGDKDPGKFTYSAGPGMASAGQPAGARLYGTGFRAPDMHYLFAGNDYYRTRFATDYYQCRTDEPGYTDGECYDDGSWDVSTFDVYTGNMELDVETSKSMTAGFVWSPTANFDIAVDYFRIEVQPGAGPGPRAPARHRGRLPAGRDRRRHRGGHQLADLRRCDPAVIRDTDGTITSVHFSPINIAREKTSGVDVTANYRLQTTRRGRFPLHRQLHLAARAHPPAVPGRPDRGHAGRELCRHHPAARQAEPRRELGARAWGASLFGTYLGRVANYNNDAWTRPPGG